MSDQPHSWAGWNRLPFRPISPGAARAVVFLFVLSLVIGALNTSSARDESIAATLQDLVALFATAAVNVTISSDVRAELWSKLMINCAYNAISGLAQATYGKLTSMPEVRAIQEAVVREVVALAAAEGVNLPLEEGLKTTAEFFRGRHRA